MNPWISRLLVHGTASLGALVDYSYPKKFKFWGYICLNWSGRREMRSKVIFWHPKWSYLHESSAWSDCKDEAVEIRLVQIIDSQIAHRHWANVGHQHYGSVASFPICFSTLLQQVSIIKDTIIMCLGYYEHLLFQKMRRHGHDKLWK